jgi:hypothetical protein
MAVNKEYGADCVHLGPLKLGERVFSALRHYFVKAQFRPPPAGRVEVDFHDTRSAKLGPGTANGLEF